MKLSVYILILVIFFSSRVFPQNEKWKDGFVITKNNDTLTGLIKRTEGGFHKKIDFKKNPNDRYEVYFAEDCKGFKWGDEMYTSIFVSKELTGIDSYSFAKIVRQGFVDLYYTRYRFMACTCNPEGIIETGYILIKDKRTMTLVNKKALSDNIKDNDALAEFLSDYSELSSLLKNNEFKYSELEKLVEKYNQWRNNH